MNEEIILVRENHKIPWGFRLTGGRDFNSPLVVSRITGESIAEKRGLKVGDIITEINNQKTKSLCHIEAQHLITDGGTFLKLIVLRGSSSIIPPALTPVRGLTPSQTYELKKKTASVISTESVYSLYEDDSFEFLDQSEDEFLEFHEPTEEEISQMMLENAEVLEENGKNVIGVNFKRFIPKCDFIKDSAVFQVLQEEQVHRELTEKEQLRKCPNKRFSTFLSQPDRPIPKPKPKLQMQNAVCHNSEKESSVDEDKSETPENSVTCMIESNSESLEITEMTNSVENTINETNDAENLNPVDKSQENAEMMDSVLESDDVPIEHTTSNNENKCAQKLEFECELQLIKNTLSSLEQLPVLIQTQLAAIQSQIDNLTRLKEGKELKEETNEIYLPDVIEQEEVDDIKSKCDTVDLQQDNLEISEIENYETELEVEPETEKENNIDYQPESTEPSDSVVNEKDDTPTKIKRPACPLTPLPRPVVLPGGRIWRKPKDAYNEEFIAETLISQAEVLVGSTLGVNFRKYEPPKLDFSNSAVYKLIHNIESKASGFENRDTIPALQDYYQSPISARHFYCANLANKNEVTDSNEEST